MKVWVIEDLILIKGLLLEVKKTLSRKHKDFMSDVYSFEWGNMEKNYDSTIETYQLPTWFLGSLSSVLYIRETLYKGA